ncbi:hypothetical protein PR048_002150 [Dryococelus australis]|uniref:AAA+ ATPase domain-containing protein n=1 Tax=Dryococelus australis TaxID=614101 RepID=A0ABQ9IJE1_9NEOP|nr:hypothetical protein PR048_002150 [Dryococelus australis]
MESEKQLSSDTSSQRRRFLNIEFSSPVRTPLQQINMRKKVLLPAPGMTLLHQFSCEQLFRQGNVAQVTHKQICLVSDTGNVHYFSSSHIEPLTSRYVDEKCTFARKLPSVPAGQTSRFERCLRWWLMCGLLLLLVVGFSIMYRFASSDSDICQHTLKTNVLEQVLKYKLYGQEQARQEIVTRIMLFSVSEGPRIEAMVFYGGTGVGKSYAASLVAKYFTWSSNVQHLICSLHDHSISSADEVISNLSLCGDNLVIFDELSIGQEEASVLFLDKLSAASKLSGFRVIVILIFNVQQRIPTQSRLNIQNTFKLRADLILFQPLEEEHITMCVREALSQQEILTSKADIDHLLSVVVPLRTGCKSVASKVAILGGKKF